MKQSESILERVSRLAAEQPERVFATLVYNSKAEIPVTYRDVYEKSRTAARGIKNSLGDQKKAVVIIMLDHTPAIFYSFIGAMVAEQIPSIFPTNFSRVDPELFKKALGELIEISDVRLVISTVEWQNRIREAGIAVPTVTPEELFEQGQKLRD